MASAVFNPDPTCMMPTSGKIKFNEGYFNRISIELQKSINSKNREQSELCFARFALGLCAHNLTDEKAQKFYRKLQDFYQKLSLGISTENIMLNLHMIRFKDEHKIIFHAMKGLDLLILFYVEMDLANLPKIHSVFGQKDLIEPSIVLENFVIDCLQLISDKPNSEIQLTEKITFLFNEIENNSKTKEYAEVLACQGFLYAKMKKFQESLPVLYRSLSFYKLLKDSNGQLKCLHAIGLMYKKLEKDNMAMTTFEHALVEFNPALLDLEATRCRLNCAYESGNYRLQKKFYNKAINHFYIVYVLSL